MAVTITLRSLTGLRQDLAEAKAILKALPDGKREGSDELAIVEAIERAIATGIHNGSDVDLEGVYVKAYGAGGDLQDGYVNTEFYRNQSARQAGLPAMFSRCLTIPTPINITLTNLIAYGYEELKYLPGFAEAEDA